MDDHSTVSAERLNGEPVIFRGCGASELLMIVIGAAVVIFPVVLFFSVLAGAFTLGIGIAAILLVAAVIVLATWFQRIKRGRPHGHYQQVLVLRLENVGLARSRMLRMGGDWDAGRREV